MTTTNYPFENNEEDKSEDNKFNIGPLIFGAVVLVSNIGFGSNVNTPIVPIESTLNSVQSYDLTSPSDKNENFPLHNEHDRKALQTLDLTKKDIFETETDEEAEVLNMDELQRLQENFDSFSKQNHDNQLEMTKELTRLTTQIESLSNELSRLNKTNEELPSIIKKEFKNLQMEKLENNKSVWIAPTITGLIIGIVLLFGEYFLNLL